MALERCKVCLIMAQRRELDLVDGTFGTNLLRFPKKLYIQKAYEPHISEQQLFLSTLFWLWHLRVRKFASLTKRVRLGLRHFVPHLL
jgi:hypothetical protein